MANVLLRAEIQEIYLTFNGDMNDSEMRIKFNRQKARVTNAEASLRSAQAMPDKTKIKQAQQKLRKERDKLKDYQPEKDNVVTASLSYPRSGESDLLAMRPFDIPSGDPVVLTNSDFFESALFKEEIQGETVLEINIADKDKKNPFWLFIRGVLSAAFKAVTKDAIGNISEVFVAGAATGVSKELEDAIKGDDKAKVSVVAKSEKVRIDIDRNAELNLTKVSDGPRNSVQFNQNSGILKLRLKAPKQLTVSQTRTNKVVKKKVIQKDRPNGHIHLKLTAERI